MPRSESQPGWMKHPDLYLTDGTLVILAGSTLFRVYGGLLAKYSEVFSGMVSLSPHQPSDAERYEECPLVRLSDSPEDLAHFLKALMDIDYFTGNGQVKSFHVVAGILRLSRKYMVATLRARAIAYITPAMPITLGEKKNLKYNLVRFQAIFGSKCCDGPTIVTLLRSCGLLHFLPWVYYTTCSLGFDSLLGMLTPMTDVAPMSLEDTRTTLRGWRILTVLDADISHRIFSAPAEKCTRMDCNEGSRALLLRDILEVRRHPRVFLERRNSRFGACTTCAEHFKRVEEAAMREAWDQLPSYFGLPSWDVLLQEERLAASVGNCGWAGP